VPVLTATIFAVATNITYIYNKTGGPIRLTNAPCTNAQVVLAINQYTFDKMPMRKTHMEQTKIEFVCQSVLVQFYSLSMLITGLTAPIVSQIEQVLKNFKERHDTQHKRRSQ